MKGRDGQDSLSIHRKNYLEVALWGTQKLSDNSSPATFQALPVFLKPSLDSNLYL